MIPLVQGAPISSLNFRLATSDCITYKSLLWRDVQEVLRVQAAAGGRRWPPARLSSR